MAVKVNNLCPINFCVNKTLQSRVSVIPEQSSHEPADLIGQIVIHFCIWRNAAKICINVITWHFTQEERVPIRCCFGASLLNNPFLVVYDRGSPRACPQITEDWLLRRQKKRTELPSKPLPLPVGLLIQTVKVLALRNPERVTAIMQENGLMFYSRSVWVTERGNSISY